MDDYTKFLPHCDKCTLNGNYADSVRAQMPSNPDLSVLFVGEAPGRTEMITKVPFSGEAGRMLYSLMRGAGINKRNAQITNTVRCRPPNNRKPSTHEMYCCRPALMRDIAMADPELIVALGDVAAYDLAGVKGIMSLRGSIGKLSHEYERIKDHLTHWDRDGGMPILFNLHPEFVRKQRHFIGVAMQDLDRIFRFIDGSLERNEHFDFVYDPDPERLEAYLNGAEIVAFDTETTGLDPFEHQIIGISFARDRDSAMDCQISSPSDPRYGVIKKFLEDPTRAKATQWGTFDVMMLKQSLGIEVQGLTFDTALAEQLLHPDLPTKLDFLRATYTDMKPYKPSKSAIKNIASWTADVRSEYACKDAVCTFQVMKSQQKAMSKDHVGLLDRLMIPMVDVVISMRSKGVKVNRDRLALAYADVQPKVQALKTAFEQEHGISISSPTQIAKHFDLKDTTKKTLQGLVNRRHPNADAFDSILKWRGLDKFASTSLIGIYNRLKERAGGHYIHTQYNLDVAATGRLSSENPNLQNIVEDYRHLFEAEPGTMFISADYKQLELRVVAVLANATSMIADLAAGKDIHGIVAAEIEPYIDQATTSKKLAGIINLRRISKGVVFGSLYGASPYTYARDFGVSVDMATAWQDALFGVYPELKIYIEARRQEFEETGHVVTPFGRRRQVFNSRQATNTPIQSSASDINAFSLLELFRDDFDLRLTTHDDVVFQVAIDKVREYGARAKAILERPIPELGGHSFPVDIKVGPNWGELKELEL